VVAKNKFVADGPWRFLRGKKAWTYESIEGKYAGELAKANLAQKPEIHRRMAEEFLRREKAVNHKPSPATLW
jgi:hypothetical protein